MTDENRCRAITRRGERCSRPAGDGGFCYQHGPADRTVDGSDTPSKPVVGDGGEAAVEEGTEAEEAEESEDTQEAEGSESEAESDSETDSGDADRSASGGLSEVRNSVVDMTENLVGRPLDNVVGIDREDDQWVAAVEVVERRAVPDTQDILARYEITLDDSASPTGYHRTDRYRRDDMDQDI